MSNKKSKPKKLRMPRPKTWHPPWDVSMTLHRYSLKGLNNEAFTKFRLKLEGLGGTDIANLLAHDERIHNYFGFAPKSYKSPHDIFIDKLGIGREVKVNHKMNAGKSLERVYMEWHRYYDGETDESIFTNMESGNVVLDIQPFEYTIQNPLLPGAFFSIDGLIYPQYEGDEYMVYEGKMVEVSLYDVKDFSPYPLHILQLSAYLWGLGLNAGILGYIINGVRPKRFLIRLDNNIAAIISDVVSEFYARLSMAKFMLSFGASIQEVMAHKPKAIKTDSFSILSKSIETPNEMRMAPGWFLSNIMTAIKNKEIYKKAKSIYDEVLSGVKDYMVKHGANELQIGTMTIKLHKNGAIAIKKDYGVIKKSFENILRSNGVDYSFDDDVIYVRGEGDVDLSGLSIMFLPDTIFVNNGIVDLSNNPISDISNIIFDCMGVILSKTDVSGVKLPNGEDTVYPFKTTNGVLLSMNGQTFDLRQIFNRLSVQFPDDVNRLMDEIAEKIKYYE